MGKEKMEITEKMTEFRLEKATTLKTIVIHAKGVGEMVDFCKKIMGFILRSEKVTCLPGVRVKQGRNY